MEEEYLDTPSFGTELEGDILGDEDSVDWRVEVEMEIVEGCLTNTTHLGSIPVLW